MVEDRVVRRRRRLRGTSNEPAQVTQVVESAPEPAAVPEEVPEVVKTVVRRETRLQERAEEAHGSSEEVDVLFRAMSRLLDRGLPLLIRKMEEGYVVADATSLVGKQAQSRRSNARALADNFFSQKYVDWISKWGLKSYEEKIEYAQGEGIEWERHEQQNIDHMRLTEAVRLAEGVDKYKPEFATREARAEARRKILAGEMD